MTQSEREALATFVISTNTGIKGLTNLMSQIAHEIDSIKERISVLERKVEGGAAELRIKEGVVERRISALESEYIQMLKREEKRDEAK